MASEKDSKKSMDISRPGKTPPDESSRPVVVSNRPMVQDPMMVKTEETATAPEPEATVKSPIEPPSHSSKVIQPLTEQTPEKDAKESTGPPEESAKPTDEEAKPPESSEAAVVDAVADQVGAGKKKGGALTEAEKAKQEALQKLVAEKKYFVPIGHGHHGHKKTSPISLILLVLLVAAAGFYLAVDAGLLGLNIKLPIDIIKT